MESSCPLPVGGSLLGLCNSPSIHDLQLGPLTQPGWDVLRLLQWGFSFPHTQLWLSPSSHLLGREPPASQSPPFHLQGRRLRPQKVKCPLLDRLGLVLWIPGWVEEGCVHSEPAGLPLFNTSVLLITLFKCLTFLVHAHLWGLLKCGGGRLAGQEASHPPVPSQGSDLP